MDSVFLIFASIIVLLISVILHEIAHGYVASLFGDFTAKYLGRLTLNPKVHIDPVGSILVPFALLVLSAGSMFFAWAKPVPYNPFNLRNPRLHSILVAVAGPATNVLIAIIAGLIIRLIFLISDPSALKGVIIVLILAMMINMYLAFFNLLPIPPLDGSKIWINILPLSDEMKMKIERNSLIFIVILMILIFSVGFEFLFILSQDMIELIAGRDAIDLFVLSTSN